MLALTCSLLTGPLFVQVLASEMKRVGELCYSIWLVGEVFPAFKPNRYLWANLTSRTNLTSLPFAVGVRRLSRAFLPIHTISVEKGLCDNV